MMWRISVHTPRDEVNVDHQYFDPFPATPCEAEKSFLIVKQSKLNVSIPEGWHDWGNYKLNRTYLIWSKDGKQDGKRD